MKRFENKVALVTGGASGIGKISAIHFAKEGAKVALSDIQEDLGQEVVKTIEDAGGKAIFTKLDVSKPKDVENWVNTTAETWGSIDCCLNNAGIGGAYQPTHLYPEDMFDKVMDINVKGVWYCMKAQLPYMLKQKSGKIVNIASAAGVLAQPQTIAYVASKHAVIGMTKTAGAEYAKLGIRVNAVCPSYTETPMVSEDLLKNTKADKEFLEKINPTKRMAQPEEIVAAILFLCSDEASYINSHSLLVDGGLSVV